MDAKIYEKDNEFDEKDEGTGMDVDGDENGG